MLDLEVICFCCGLPEAVGVITKDKQYYDARDYHGDDQEKYKVWVKVYCNSCLIAHGQKIHIKDLGVAWSGNRLMPNVVIDHFVLDSMINEFMQKAFYYNSEKYSHKDLLKLECQRITGFRHKHKRQTKCLIPERIPLCRDNPPETSEVSFQYKLCDNPDIFISEQELLNE